MCLQICTYIVFTDSIVRKIKRAIIFQDTWRLHTGEAVEPTNRALFSEHTHTHFRALSGHFCVIRQTWVLATETVWQSKSKLQSALCILGNRRMKILEEKKMCQCWAYTECCSYQQLLNDGAKQLALASALHQVKVRHALFQMQETAETMNADTMVICMRDLRACGFRCPCTVGYTSLTQPFTD